MSTEAEEAVVETETDALVGNDAPAHDDQGESAEDKATRTGWRPKDQFKGNPEDWVDAETFNKRGETNAATVRQLEKANAKLVKDMAEMKATMKEYGAEMSKRVKAEYARAVKDIEGRLDEATEAGDVEGARAAARDMADLKTDMEAGAKPNGKDEAPAELQDAAQAFIADNPWFNTNTEMTGAANAISAELNKPGGKFDPHKDAEAHFAEVARRIKAAFPQSFGNPRRQDPAAVEGAPGHARKGEKSFNDLPQAAKDQAIKWEKSGLLSRADYVKDYDFTQGAAR